MVEKHEMNVIEFDKTDVFADEDLESGQEIVGAVRYSDK